MNTSQQDGLPGLMAEETRLRQELAQNPQSPYAQNNLALVLRKLGRAAESEALLQKAASALPDSADVAYNWGVALLDLRRYPEGEAALRRALALRPDFPQAAYLIGALVASRGRLAEAEALLRAAIGGVTHRAAAHTLLGEVLRQSGRLEEAEIELRRALSLDPNLFDAHKSLGLVLHSLHRLPEAESATRQALVLRPASVLAAGSLGMTLLKMGRYAEGFEWMESRYVESPEWTQSGTAFPYTPAAEIGIPIWRGEPLAGKSLLVLCEQGLGDMIQWVRFVPALRALGVAKLTVMCPMPLARLFSHVEGIDAVIEGDRPVSFAQFDVFCYMMSLLHRLGVTLDTLRPAGAYFRLPAKSVRSWQARLQAFPLVGRRKIGLVWSGGGKLGNPASELPSELHDNAQRSIPLERLRPLLHIPNCAFFSLQKVDEAGQLARIPEAIRPVDLMSGVADFYDTAAFISNLDLVISVDTAVAHLAGALDKPVWILSRFDGDWRWHHGREDSPWYASARVFTQAKRGNWDDVIARIESALKAFAAS
ncbi:tetratricopeptide repeat protein [Caballeronia insecticola]|nr:tetratricopeptide repeat-containing glycosyltransferase family protein [Caballeronia insecticola]